jgi:uncharacterized membrane protein
MLKTAIRKGMWLRYARYSRGSKVSGAFLCDASGEYEPPKFRTPGPYRLVRHPLYLGFVIAFWSAPHMTSGRLFFAVMCTGYILVAIQLEERDLMTIHGESYRVYKSGVSMLVPLPGKKSAPGQEPASAAHSAGKAPEAAPRSAVR